MSGGDDARLVRELLGLDGPQPHEEPEGSLEEVPLSLSLALLEREA